MLHSFVQFLCIHLLYLVLVTESYVREGGYVHNNAHIHKIHCVIHFAFEHTWQGECSRTDGAENCVKEQECNTMQNTFNQLLTTYVLLTLWQGGGWRVE